MFLEGLLLTRRFDILKILTIMATGVLEGIVVTPFFGPRITATLWLGLIVVLWCGADRFQRRWVQAHLQTFLQGFGSLDDVQRVLNRIHGTANSGPPHGLADALHEQCPDLMKRAEAALMCRTEIARLQRFVKEVVEPLTVRDDPTPAVAALRAHVWPLVRKVRVAETLDILDCTERSLARWLDAVRNVHALEKVVSILGDPSEHSDLLGLALDAAMMRLKDLRNPCDRLGSQNGQDVRRESTDAQVVSVAYSGRRKTSHRDQTENERSSACGLACCLSN